MNSNLSIFARATLRIAVIAPLGLGYAIVASMHGYNLITYALLVCSILSIVLSAGILGMIKSRTGISMVSSVPEQHRITGAKKDVLHEATFFLLFLMPLFSILHDTAGFVWFPIAALYGVFLMAGNWCYSNPLFGLFGWKSYRVDTPEDVNRCLLSKRDIEDGNQEIIGIQINDYIILDTG